MTPKKARKLDQAKGHAVKAKEAAEVLIAHLHHPDSPGVDPVALLTAAKVLEASGCYIRRAIPTIVEGR